MDAKTFTRRTRHTAADMIERRRSAREIYPNARDIFTACQRSAEHHCARAVQRRDSADARYWAEVAILMEVRLSRAGAR